jgi:hypothetical protein
MGMRFLTIFKIVAGLIFLFALVGGALVVQAIRLN